MPRYHAHLRLVSKEGKILWFKTTTRTFRNKLQAFEEGKELLKECASKVNEFPNGSRLIREAFIHEVR